MAKTEGYAQYVCDRCNKSMYATDGSPDAQSWRTVRRITADGTETSRLLCPACNAEYRALAQSQDSAFGDFMAAKEE